jgi:hypothetical protein
MEPVAMEAGKILHQLTYAEGLPKEALKAATAQREKMLPLFIEEIEAFLAREPAARETPTPLFFIFHLLGEWREKAAYRPLAPLLRLAGPEVDRIFGDGITTTSHRVMAAVFDGDPEPLSEIILDPRAEQFIRAGMCEALAMVTLRGELDRARAGRFLRCLYENATASTELRLGRLAERHCKAGHERSDNSGQKGIRQGLH